MSGKGSSKEKVLKIEVAPERKKLLKSPDDPITPGEIKRLRNFNNLPKLIGKDDPTDEDIVRYIIRSREKKISEERARRREESAPFREESRRKQKEQTSREAFFEEKLDEYKKAFEIETPNDHTNVEQLVSIELRLKEIKDSDRSSLDTKALQQLAQEEASLRREWREIQRTLAIDKPSRRKQQTEKNAQEVIQDMIAESKDFLEQEMERVICPRCFTEVGWVWYNFRNDLMYGAYFTCGCGERIHLGNLEYYRETVA